MNAILVAAAIWMGPGAHPAEGRAWSSEFDKYRSLGRAEAHLTGTLLSGATDRSQQAALEWYERGGPIAARDDAALRELGRAEAWYPGAFEGAVSENDLLKGSDRGRLVCPQGRTNPRAC